MSSQKSSNMSQWTKGRLPRDVVEPYSQRLEEYDDSAPTDAASMRRRIFQVLYIRNGCLDTRHLVYGKNTARCCRLFNETATCAMHALRSARLDMVQLASAPLDGVASLLASSPNLTSIEFVGYEYGKTPNLVRNLAILLEGLSRNAAGRLESIKIEFFQPEEETSIDKYLIQFFFHREPSEREESTIIESLQQIKSVTRLNINGCSEGAIGLILRGLRGSHVKDIDISSSSNSMPRWLSHDLESLPKLESLSIREWDADYADLRDLHNSASKLKHLSLSVLKKLNYEEVAKLLRRMALVESLVISVRQGFMDDNKMPYDTFGHPSGSVDAAIVSMKNLKHLNVENFIEPETLRYCKALQSLSFADNREVPPLWLISLLAPGTSIENVQFRLTGETLSPTLRLLRYNSSIRSVRLDWGGGYRSHFISDFREALQTNSGLKMLHIPCLPEMVPVFTDLLRSNRHGLEHLCLEAVGGCVDEVLPDIFQALKNNTTLMKFEVKDPEGECADPDPGCVERFFDVIRGNTSLESIDFEMCILEGEMIDVDKLAGALCENTTLQNITLGRHVEGGCLHNQPTIDFVCRLFGRRNQILQLAQRKETFDALWPHLLGGVSRNPTALFMALKVYTSDDSRV